MAILIRTDGSEEAIVPPRTGFGLAELQTLVGGYIEIVKTVDGRLMVIDEEGKLKRKPVNLLASILYPYGASDRVVGDVVVVEPREIGEDEELVGA